MVRLPLFVIFLVCVLRSNIVVSQLIPGWGGEMIKEQFTAFCLSLLPWLGPLVYRDGVTPP